MWSWSWTRTLNMKEELDKGNKKGLMSFIDYAFSYSIPLNRVEITVYTFQLQNHVSKLVMALKQGNKLIQ